LYERPFFYFSLFLFLVSILESVNLKFGPNDESSPNARALTV